MIRDNGINRDVEKPDNPFHVWSGRCAYNANRDIVPTYIIKQLLDPRVKGTSIDVGIGALPVTVVAIGFQNSRINESKVQIEYHCLHGDILKNRMEEVHPY